MDKIDKAYTFTMIMMGILILVLIIVCVLEAIDTIKTNPEEAVIEYETYIVKAGETLWSIAANIGSDEDIREIVYYIRKDNNITDCGSLQVGQELKIRLDF